MDKIEDYFEIYKSAVWEKNAKTLLHLYDENTVSFDMWDKGFHKNLQEWSPEIEDWLGSLKNEKVKVGFEMIKYQKSETLSFSSGLITFQAISNEGKVIRSMKNRITLCFSKIQNKWKVVHQHISAPVKSDDLTAILDI